MKKKIDFIFEDSGNNRKIFRFYPRRSHVHGFDDECPKNWKEVYKVYYAWSVIWQYRWDDSYEWDSRTCFEMECDECSELVYLKDHILNLKPNETVDIPSLSAALWRIKFFAGDLHRRIRPYYEFTVWERYSGRACCFWLSRKETRQFVKYLDYVQDYMLEHSEPI